VAPHASSTRDDQVHREIAKVCDQRGYRNNTLKASTVLASRPLLIDDPRDPRRHFEFQFSFFILKNRADGSVFGTVNERRCVGRRRATTPLRGRPDSDAVAESCTIIIWDGVPPCSRSVNRNEVFPIRGTYPRSAFLAVKGWVYLIWEHVEKNYVKQASIKQHFSVDFYTIVEIICYFLKYKYLLESKI